MKKTKRSKIRKPTLKEKRDELRDEIERLENSKLCLQSKQKELANAVGRLEDLYSKLSGEKAHLECDVINKRSGVAEILNQFKPSSGVITLPSGDFPMASAFTVGERGYFLIGEFDAIVSAFRKHNQGGIVFLMCTKLMLRAFGFVQRSAKYDNVHFLVTDAIPENKVVVVSNQFVP